MGACVRVDGSQCGVWASHVDVCVKSVCGGVHVYVCGSVHVDVCVGGGRKRRVVVMVMGPGNTHGVSSTKYQKKASQRGAFNLHR